MKNISREIDQSLRLRHCERLEEQRICLYIYLYTYGFMCFQDKRIST
jgi:predicted RNA-binding protein (virulence factor B family)